MTKELSELGVENEVKSPVRLKHLRHFMLTVDPKRYYQTNSGVVLIISEQTKVSSCVLIMILMTYDEVVLKR